EGASARTDAIKVVVTSLLEGDQPKLETGPIRDVVAPPRAPGMPVWVVVGVIAGGLGVVSAAGGGIARRRGGGGAGGGGGGAGGVRCGAVRWGRAGERDAAGSSGAGGGGDGGH